MLITRVLHVMSCCCYHKGTYFQANHNRYGVSSYFMCCCCCYHKGTYFQANHNQNVHQDIENKVVVATTKVRIFKQITTNLKTPFHAYTLLLLPQRYVFSSKSQPDIFSLFKSLSCCCYHKGTYFQANHNLLFIVRVLAALLLLPQRYVFSSKSQRNKTSLVLS